jgi:acetyltransferase-like isoleucine patch superfamily enzyme
VSAFRNLLFRMAVRNRRWEGPYRRLAKPSGVEWARMLRERGSFHSMGENCSIDPHALISGPMLVRLGNNVRMASCAIFVHDGSVNMINRAYGLNLDSVGAVDIRDNVFIGFGAIIMPGVRIGPNAIVSAGSMVRADVAEGDVVAGVPAKRVGRLDLSVAMLKAKNQKWPWRPLIEKRAAAYDAAMEPELMRMRAAYFFGGEDRR